MNFTKSGKRFLLYLHYNGGSSSLFVNATKIYHLKKDYTLCLGNMSKGFKINDMKKTEIKGCIQSFSVDFNPIDTDLMIIIPNNVSVNEMFIALLPGPVKGPNHIRCVLSSNQKCMNQPTFMNLHPKQKFSIFYLPFC